MNVHVLEALAAVRAMGFAVEAFRAGMHVREVGGVTVVSAVQSAADAIRFNVQAAERVVLFLAAGARLTSFISQGPGHVAVVGADAQVSGVTFYGERNLAVFGDETRLLTTNIVRGVGNRLQVGERCVGSGGTIRTSDDHTIFDVTSGDPINRARDVRIGNQVYLGRNVRVSKGADIGDGVVVAPDSVVTGKLKAGSYYGGVPARLIKPNVTWKARY